MVGLCLCLPIVILHSIVSESCYLYKLDSGHQDPRPRAIDPLKQASFRTVDVGGYRNSIQDVLVLVVVYRKGVQNMPRGVTNLGA